MGPFTLLSFGSCLFSSYLFLLLLLLGTVVFNVMDSR
jgi:hypothetical protein